MENSEKINSYFGYKLCSSYSLNQLEKNNKHLSDFYKIHGNTYLYPIQIFNSRIKMKVVCKKHGPFFILPYNHKTGSGCKECMKEKFKIIFKKSSQDWVKEFNEVHNHKYIYPISIEHSLKKIKIICSLHGEFFQTPHNHILGHSCPKCVRKTTEEWIKDFNIVHNFLYIYPLFIDKSNVKIDIQCIQHGYFRQTPEAHKRGNGCPTCSLNYKQSMWNYDRWETYKNKAPKFDNYKIYIIECFDENSGERFLKIGKTYNTLIERFRKLPYHFISLYEKIFINPKECSEMEIKLINMFKKYQYNPHIKFAGHTECLCIQCKDEVLNATTNL